MNLTSLAKDYFNAFKNQDIDTLTKMFDESIKLSDWEIKVIDKKNVIEQIRVIFKSLDEFALRVIDIKNIGFTVYAEILITTKDKTKIKVLDKITFNKRNKIIDITAFKG
tara:strand:- start:343 stop:672 length:330 start_codon:yes stop_codon:yes gene_type:complete